MYLKLPALLVVILGLFDVSTCLISEMVKSSFCDVIYESELMNGQVPAK